jgi:hypothetical protein
MQLSKRETCLLISPTSLAELERSHVKKFSHQSGYHSLVGWFHITIESEANRQYSWLVRSVSPQFVF